MSTILKNVVEFTGLVVGVPVSLPHGLNLSGIPVAPQLGGANASNFAVTADTVNVTVTRGAGATGDAVNIYVEHWHTIEEVLPPSHLAGLTPFFFAADGTSGGPGGTFQELTITPAITPPALPAGETNDYNPIGFATTTRIRQATSAAHSSLSGLVAQGDGDVRIITNLGPGTLTLENEDPNSAAANRFITGISSVSEMPGVSLEMGGAAVVVYTSALARWQVIATSGISKILLAGFNVGFNGTRIIQQSLTPGNAASTMRWLDSTGAFRFSMGNDVSSNNGQNFWLFDNVNFNYPFYFEMNPGGDSSIRMGPTVAVGRIRYEATPHNMSFYTNAIVRAVLGDTGLAMSAGQVIHVGGAAGPLWTGGAGTPEGAITAPVGSMFSRTDGGVGTSFYVKESGVGNTGWVAK